MILVPSAVPAAVPVFRRLIDPQLFPQARGSLTVEALGAGARAQTEADTESATVVLTGRVRWGSWVLGPGAGLFHPPGSRYGLTVGASPAVVLTVHGRAARQSGAAGTVLLSRQSEDGTLTRSGGYDGMGVHWLATEESVGSRQLTVATSTFTPGGSHELHRHPDADEFFLVLSGGGDHLTESGRVRLAPGDLAYVPAGEWHGYRSRLGVTTAALYGYLGAPSLDRAGYQVAEVA